MSNPTSNFGWQMPTPTDLVTNLPADFEVFGQAVDSDFADLKGGTTGQVLAKASNADLDFVWSADAAGMTNPMTTTGDTIYSSSGSTPARLGIGSTGQVLTVASGIPSWQTPAGGGGMTLLSTTSLTSNTNTISSISNAYKNLVILIRGSYGSVDNQQVRFRLNGDSGANYAYGAVGVRLGGAGVIGNTSGTSDTNVFFGNGHNANAFNKQLNADMVIYRYTTSQPTYYEWNSMSAADATNSNWIMFSGAGTYNSSAAVSSITFYCDNGTWSGGTVYIYGVN